MKKRISGLIFFLATGLALVVAVLLVVKYADLSQTSKLSFLKKQNQVDQSPLLHISDAYPYFPQSSTTKTLKLEFNPNAKSYSTEFSEPYPISWKGEDDEISFNLTGIKISNFTVADSEPVIFLKNYPYALPIGTKIYALQLIVNIGIGSTPYCGVNISARMLEGENLIAPDNQNSGLEFSSINNCNAPYNSFPGKKIIFAVSETQKEFILTTGGNDNIFFKIKTNDDGTITLNKIATPDRWKGKVIGADINHFYTKKPQGPLGFYWAEPSLPEFTVERGEDVTFEWQPGTYTGNVSFSISQLNSNDNYAYSQSISDQLSKGSTVSTINVPPGVYIIAVSSPYNATARKVKLTVTGSTPLTDTNHSKIYLSGSDTVISDGTCKTIIYVQTKDQYGYPVNDSSISLRSNRRNDTISKNTDYTTDYYSMGYAYFNFQSNSIGTSTLTAYSGANQIPGKIIIKVLDSNENNCPENTNRYNNYYGEGI